jgi:methionyl-tRNA formyltransferase
MNIIFMGTPDFAIPALEEINKHFNVSAVVTTPDKPKGRGKKLSPSPIKEKAIELGLPILQPESLKSPEFAEQIKELNPDIICVIAFKILPPAVYEVAKIASFNIHGSLLPRYRGAAPINRAIINGDTETGLTSFILQRKVDTGDILLKSKTEIPDDASFGDMYEKLKSMAPQLAIDTIELLKSGDYSPLTQDENDATPAPKIFKQDCEINWDMPAKDVRNFIRGVSPVPCAWTRLNGESLKIYTAELSEISLPYGEYRIDDEKFLVGCSQGSLALSKIQLPGKKPVMISDFLRGWRGDKTGKLG